MARYEGNMNNSAGSMLAEEIGYRAYVKVAGEWQKAKCWLKKDGQWKPAIPHAKHNHQWS